MRAGVFIAAPCSSRPPPTSPGTAAASPPCRSRFRKAPRPAPATRRTATTAPARWRTTRIPAGADRATAPPANPPARTGPAARRRPSSPPLSLTQVQRTRSRMAQQRAHARDHEEDEDALERAPAQAVVQHGGDRDRGTGGEVHEGDRMQALEIRAQAQERERADPRHQHGECEQRVDRDLHSQRSWNSTSSSVPGRLSSASVNARSIDDDWSKAKSSTISNSTETEVANWIAT